MVKYSPHAQKFSCTVRLHACRSLLSTNFMTTREPQMIPFGGSNTDLRVGSQQLQPLGHETTTLYCSYYPQIKSNHNSWNNPGYISPTCGWERQFSQTLQPLPGVAYTFGSSIYLEPSLFHTYAVSLLPLITPGTQGLYHILGRQGKHM